MFAPKRSGLRSMTGRSALHFMHCMWSRAKRPTERTKTLSFLIKRNYVIVTRLNLNIRRESMRVITPTLLALMLFSNVACSRSSPEQPGQWQPIQNVPGGFRRYLVGDTTKPGPYKYELKIPAGARLTAHKHSVDVHVKVVSGSMFIIIGEPLESSRAQHFTAGSVFVVPAHAWHDEWWDKESLLEAEGIGPMQTVYKDQ